MSTAPTVHQGYVSDEEAESDRLSSVLAETDRQLASRPEMLQMRLENESIMAECRVRPRDMKKIKQALLDQLDAFPELADKAIYEKPVGDNKTVRGLSIRAAECIAEVYGYCRVRSDVTPLDNDRVKVEATFTDFQNGRLWQDGGIVSMYYTAAKGSGGGRRRYTDDRFYGVVVKAEASRRVREVVLRSVNSGLKEWFYTECERRLETILDDGKVDGIVKKFEAKGATLMHLETFIGRPRTMGWTADDRRKLLGVWNVIADGEANLDEVFGLNKPANGETPKTIDELGAQLQQQLANSKTSPPEQTSSKEAPKQEPAKASTSTSDAWSKFKAELAVTQQITDARNAYDKWFGPDRPAGLEWSPEQNTEAVAARDNRIKEIHDSRASRGKKQSQGALLDTSPTAQSSGT